MHSARTRIVIGGVRTPGQALDAVEHGADAVGFMFSPASPAYLDPESAYELMASLPPFVASLGVFVNPTLDEFSDAEEACPTTHSLLAGAEAEKLVRQCGPGVIKGITLDPHTLDEDLDRWLRLDEVDGVQIDLPENAPADPEILARAVRAQDKPVILGGVLPPDRVGELVRVARPYALHWTLPPDADEGEIERFCTLVRRAGV